MQRTDKKREAAPIAMIRARCTGKHVGWLYRWNDGALGYLWMQGPVVDVMYQTLHPDGP